jgi:hypothetical protein
VGYGFYCLCSEQDFATPPRSCQSCGRSAAVANDGRLLGHRQIALAQLDALTFGQLGQLFDRAVGEPCVGRMRNRLLLDGGGRWCRPPPVRGLCSPSPPSDAPPTGTPARARLSGSSLKRWRQRVNEERSNGSSHHLPAEVLEVRVSPLTGRTVPRRRDCASA